MKLLLDEQISGKVADRLRRRGHDVVAVIDEPRLKSMSDPAIFAAAQRQGRVVVTYNRDDFEVLARESDGYGGGHHGLVIVHSTRIHSQDFGRLVGALAALLERPPRGRSFQIWLRPGDAPD